ncbi:MAG: coenzyme F420-0:L-glutamate ligase [Methanobrevibacter ruminantium]|uniref:coenzyme F420-0:L-glutamate ligase n=2 Tax=Methanobrevibacter ruminantium TaxID=83816 RepID=UPI0026F1C884|nr:coenzyme F420-0:L-glutamate ligase [Methanobrevibacter ruminantium]MDO5842775.1 coenzyme F420-0:L-glutamate ligase [Methanobrevibacter ruminantium]
MTTNPTYKEAETEKGQKYKYVEIKGYKVIPIETHYIKPNESIDFMIDDISKLANEGDYLVIAETPISVSQGRLVDEADYTPSLKATFLATYWSKYFWGYVLGPILGIKERTIKNLRKLPEESKRHKEVVLQLYGWKHALKPASEAGIDLSNAPGTCVSLLPENPEKVAKEISADIKNKTSNTITTLIIDTDATYRIGNKYFTGLPIAIPGIEADKGVFGYTLGQLSENLGSTPLGCSREIDVDEAIEIANVAEDYQKSLSTAMETIYSVKDVLDSDTHEVTVESLDSIIHTPAVLIRKME